MSTSKPQFVYVTYISTTPEKLWNALTDGELTKQYWVRHRNASDWKPGSPWRHEDYDNPNLVDIAGQVVESCPPRRLVLTWANPSELADPAKSRASRSRLSHSKMSCALPSLTTSSNPAPPCSKASPWGGPWSSPA
jgi:uncharacterized protein YndB with AHSA1/START domain